MNNLWAVKIVIYERKIPLKTCHEIMILNETRVTLMAKSHSHQRLRLPEKSTSVACFVTALLIFQFVDKLITPGSTLTKTTTTPECMRVQCEPKGAKDRQKLGRPGILILYILIGKWFISHRLHSKVVLVVWWLDDDGVHTSPPGRSATLKTWCDIKSEIVCVRAG